ncbi:virulence-associated protein [Pseudarcicella hirudinis]|uniref:Virulence-associated protein n=1 Tax=Pseudarcicella hirudinis TaxID=1079859 RepID=A0A1I5PAN6_9BACT|nr:VapA/VapB family virulence-associated protein [Pseudarcicella hirudinis]SFP31149.1 virulence-associated protein [Pseudarcicella hirudinis]
MSVENNTISKTSLVSEVSSALQGKVSDSVIKSTAEVLAAQTTAYGANGSIASLVFYMKCQCTITGSGGKTFNGSAWGVSFPGGGALFGDVYTDNLNALYANTVSFTLVATPVYTTFIFNDVHGNALGSFQAGAVSTVSGTAGGSGSWS